MRWSWRQRTKPIEPRPIVSIRAMELETDKEILAVVFGARPGEIKMRLEERSWGEEKDGRWPEESGEKLWPATFFLGE